MESGALAPQIHFALQLQCPYMQSLYRRIIYGAIVTLGIAYILCLLLAAVFLIPLCSDCPIEGLWAILWVFGLVSIVAVGHFGWQELRGLHIYGQMTGIRVILLRVFYAVSVLVFMVWITVLIIYATYFGNTRSHYDGKSTQVPGISGQITISLDQNQLLHISAASDQDVMFGQGFAHAQYRLFQMETQRRLGRGRLAEVLGSAALAIDQMSLSLQFYVSAQQTLGYLPSSTLSAIQSYCDGINYYISKHFDSTVEFNLLEFKPTADWSPADVIVYAKLVSYELSGNKKDEMARLKDHMIRNVSGWRLSQLDPPDNPLTTTTIVSDAALGNRYANFTPSNHRSISLESEVALLDSWLATTTPRREAMGDQTKVGSSTDSTCQGASDLSESIIKKANSMLPSLFYDSRTHSKASNSWTVSGKFSATGKPILCNDPHLTLSTPSVWTLIHLQGPDFNVVGASFPGLPGIPIGRNDFISWGITSSFADVQDLYAIEEVDENTYLWNGTQLQYEVQQHSIPVKGSQTVAWSVKLTVYGPVISPLYSISSPFALRWTSLLPNDTTFQAFYLLFRAKDWSDFRNAMAFFVTPPLNFVYADVAGNIGYQLAGKIPTRVNGHTGSYPVPGNGSFDWTGYLDFWTQSLFTLNPPEGFIVTANNMATTSTYPFLLVNDRDWEPHYRAERITQLLSSSVYPFSLNDMATIQGDQMDLFAFEYLPHLRYLHSLSTNAEAWKDRLSSWNGAASGSSVDALVFQVYWTYLMNIPSKETNGYFQNPRYFINMLRNQTYPDPACSAQLYDCGATCGIALSNAINDHHLGGTTLKRTWANVHRTMIDNPIFGSTSVECIWNRYHPEGGSYFTVNVATFDPLSFETTEGPSYRQIVDLQNTSNSLFIIPGGQSGSITSPYYDNWFDLYNQLKYIPMATQSWYREHSWTLWP